MPDHRRVDRPEWQALWHAYSDVTTPLRALGLTCDIETCGGNTLIMVDLPDGTHLLISDYDSLPDHRSQVTGWMVSQGTDQDPLRGTVYNNPFYDSTENGEHHAYGADLGSMLRAVTAWIRQTYPQVGEAVSAREAAALNPSTSAWAAAPNDPTDASTGAVSGAPAPHTRIIESPPATGPKR